MSNRPGGEFASRPLQFMFITDCSGSMAGKKIESVNVAIREAIPAMQQVALENPNAQIQVRAIKFWSGAQWHLSQPTDIGQFRWTDLSAGGVTDMGAAFQLAADALKTEAMPARGLPPVLVLLSDGQPTDDWEKGLKALMAQPWGSRAVRIAIGIGDDFEPGVLQKFIGNPEQQPLVATNAPSLVQFIKWASTVPVKAASSPATRPVGATGSAANVPIPLPPPPVTTGLQPGDVF